MPFDIKDSSGNVVATFESQPTQQDLKDLDTHLSGGATAPVEKPSVLSRAASNIGSSAWNYAKGMVQPIVSPIQTGTSLANLLSGAITKGASHVLPVSEDRLQEPDVKAYENAKGYYGDRYGGLENIKETIANDPVGAVGDLAALLGIGGGAASKLGKLGNIGTLEKAGAAVSTAANAIEPTSLAMLPVKGATKALAATSLPEKLYGSATKMPLGKKWVQTLPGREISDREAAIAAGLENSILPTNFGAATTKNLESGVRNQVGDIVSAGASRGDSARTLEDIIMPGTKQAYQKAGLSSDPAGALEQVDAQAMRFMEHGDEIPTDKLLGVKRQLYDEVTFGGADKTGLSAQLSEASKKGLAHAAKAKLEELYPEIRGLNQKDAAYIKLQEGIDRAIGRIQNSDIQTLKTSVGAAAQNPIIGALNYVVDNPIVKAQVGILLNKARKTPIQNNIAPTRMALTQAGQLNKSAGEIE
jgi:hypothetical protein